MKRAWYKKWWVWVLGVIVLIVIGVMIGKGDNSVEAASSEANFNNPDSNETVEMVPYEAELGSGHYTSGIDFRAGTYDIEAVSGGGNVISDNAYSGGINAILGTEQASETLDIYEQKYSNIDLPKGTILSISGGVVVKISSDNASSEPLESRDQPNRQVIELENGNFVAGVDFPAGVYDIIAVDGGGNVTSDNAYTGYGINAIMGTEDMNSTLDFYEQEYKNVKLPEGTTLDIRDVKIELFPSY